MQRIMLKDDILHSASNLNILQQYNLICVYDTIHMHMYIYSPIYVYTKFTNISFFVFQLLLLRTYILLHKVI